MDATEYVTEVPECLNRLMKLVMRGFYSTEPMLIIDLLLRTSCMKEEHIVDLLKLDKKQMGSSLKTLKNDQFIKQRMKVDVDAEGKTTKHNYYFINYTGFINVCKYKLDHVRRKLETQERDSTSRASFKCAMCEKTYTDLEADYLCDMNTGLFKCMMCGSEMEEQQSSAPVKDARALMAKFNEQIAVIYNLLKQCDKIKLHSSVLNPEPTDPKHLISGRKQPASTQSSSHTTWSGDASRRMAFGATEATIDVRVGDSAVTDTTVVTKKDQPEWMSKSTISGVDAHNHPQSTQPTSTVTVIEQAAPAPTQMDSNIMNTLLVHEHKDGPAAPLPIVNVALEPERNGDSDMDEMENEPNGSGEQVVENDEEDELKVSVGDLIVPFHEAADLVDEMTPDQLEAYNKLAQTVYSELYD